MEGGSRSGPLWLLCATCVAMSTAGCAPAEQDEPDTDVASAEEPATQPLPGHLRLQQHMRHMAAVPPEDLAEMMPMHLEEVGSILDELEPTSMGMQADTVWRITLDSVQNDLALMRDMPPEELRAYMPEHARRVDRLIILHDSAMGRER